MAETNDKKAAKAGIGYTLGNILLRGISVISAPLFGRFIFSVQDNGAYSIFQAYYSMIYLFLGLALHTSLKNAKNDYKEKLQQYSADLLLLIGINSLICLGVFTLFSNSLFAVMKLNKMIMLYLVIVESFVLAIITYYNSYLSVDYNYKEYIVVSVIYSVSTLLFSVILIFTLFDDERYMGRIVGTLIPGVAICIYIIGSIWKKARPRINITNYKYALKLSLPIVPHGVSQILLAQFDRLMINSHYGEYETGLYSFAYTVGSTFMIISTSLDTSWTQWLFDKMNDKEKNLPKIKKVTDVYVAGMAILACAMLLVGPELMLILGGRKYEEGIIAVFPITMSMFFAFLYNIPAAIEYYYKKTGFIAVGTVLAAILNIVLNIIFIPRYGYVAAAYTTLACYLFYYFIHLFISNRIYGGFMFNMLPQILSSIAVVIMGLIAILLKDNMIVRWAMLIVLVVVTAIFKGKEIYRIGYGIFAKKEK